jgi:ubiquinone/menaquinone biosynthesis C-methylase UbiE
MCKTKQSLVNCSKSCQPLPAIIDRWCPISSHFSSGFDKTAETFELHRALPAAVPESIRSEILAWLTPHSLGRVLDLGAGTGRIGRAFVEAGDLYTGVDLSFEMLRKFGTAAALVQADGEYLPFPGLVFDVVLMMHVLSGLDRWRPVLAEARRVLRKSGVIAVGHTVSPPDGIDQQMKRRLSSILDQQGVTPPQPKKQRGAALACLESAAQRTRSVTSESWISRRTPRNFIARHRTGGKFGTLPIAAQEQALEQVALWAETQFGSLDAEFEEHYQFETHLFGFWDPYHDKKHRRHYRVDAFR